GAMRFRPTTAAATWTIGLMLAGAACAEMPPIVPRQVLFGNSERDWPQLSPDAHMLAYLARDKKGNTQVWVKTLGASDDSMMTRSEHGGGIGIFSWAWDGKHLLHLEDHNGDENQHLWSLELGSAVRRDLTPFDGARASNLITSPNAPNEVLIGLNIRDPRIFDMYRV